jgi:hypothetical protein
MSGTVIGIAPGHNSVWQHLSYMERTVKQYQCTMRAGLEERLLPKADLYIVSGPQFKETCELIRGQQPRAKIALLFVSATGQYEMENEWRYVSERLRYVEQGKADYFFSGEHDLENLIKEPYIKQLPQCMPYGDYQSWFDDVDETAIGFLNTRRVKKNAYNCLAGIGLYMAKHPECTLHMVGNPNGEQLEWLWRIGLLSKFKIESHPFMENDAFIQLVARMGVGVECSWSESFNYIAAQYVLQGRPCLTSQAIPWSPYTWWANPNSPESICDYLGLVSQASLAERRSAYEMLIETLDENIAICERTLEEALNG